MRAGGYVRVCVCVCVGGGSSEGGGGGEYEVGEEEGGKGCGSVVG